MRARGLVLLLPLVAACTSVRVSSLRTSCPLPPHFGEVAIYTTGTPASYAPVGDVKVEARGSEAAIDRLLPLFVRRAAALGANAAVVDRVRARFEIVPRPQVETYTYACPWRSTCVATRTIWVNEEVLVVALEGRAVTTTADKVACAAPAEAP